MQSPHNQNDFINRLPVELLIVIFLDVLASSDGIDRINFPVSLSQVSRHWRELSIATPSLWTYTWWKDGDVKSERIAVQLARSRNHPLDVDLKWGEADSETEELCRLLIPEMERAQSVKLEGNFKFAIRFLLYGRLDSIKMLPLLENLELRVDYAPDLHFLLQQLSCPRIKRLHIWDSGCMTCSPLPYSSLTVLVLKNCAASVRNVGLLFREMPQIQEFQLLAARGVIPSPAEEPGSGIIAPSLRRFCVVPDVMLWSIPWTQCLAVTLIRYLEAPELRELVFGFGEWSSPAVRIPHGAERWGVQFPKLDVVGLWYGLIEGADLRKLLLSTFQNVRRFRFRSRPRNVAEIVDVLTELVERGELVRLETLDLYGITIWVVHEGLKSRMAPLPLRVRMHRNELVVGRLMNVDEVVARVRSVVKLEVYEDEHKEWVY
ncbi:hypothetical protein FRB99_000004 [Tulasnella sp. 403]|nr:hypothetical protein FRB99_000004 [Tulasnella sp. 403]